MKEAKETVGTAKPIMTTVMGTKKIYSSPMTRGDYNKYRGWKIPENEDPSDAGYLVEYPDSSSNHPNHAGYISWTPKHAYLSAYRKNGNLTFGHAIVALKEGKRVQRKGWNGKGMFIFMQIPSQVPINIVPKMTSLPQNVKDEFKRRFEQYENSTNAELKNFRRHAQSIQYQNQIAMVYPDNNIYGWVASPSDVLEEDWCILD